jgi:hypothetical protein
MCFESPPLDDFQPCLMVSTKFFLGLPLMADLTNLRKTSEELEKFRAKFKVKVRY